MAALLTMHGRSLTLRIAARVAIVVGIVSEKRIMNHAGGERDHGEVDSQIPACQRRAHIPRRARRMNRSRVACRSWRAGSHVPRGRVRCARTSSRETIGRRMVREQFRPDVRYEYPEYPVHRQDGSARRKALPPRGDGRWAHGTPPRAARSCWGWFGFNECGFVRGQQLHSGTASRGAFAFKLRAGSQRASRFGFSGREKNIRGSPGPPWSSRTRSGWAASCRHCPGENAPPRIAGGALLTCLLASAQGETEP